MRVGSNLKKYDCYNATQKLSFSDFFTMGKTRRVCCLSLFLGFCSYALAIKFQEQVIDAWEGHGLSGHDELKEAQRLLEQLKKKAQGTSSKEPMVRALPLPHNRQVSIRNSQPAVSVREKLPGAI